MKNIITKNMIGILLIAISVTTFADQGQPSSAGDACLTCIGKDHVATHHNYKNKRAAHHRSYDRKEVGKKNI